MSPDTLLRTDARPSDAQAISRGRPAVPAVSGKTTRALGTFCSVMVTSPGALDAAQMILDAELAAIDLACSRFRPDSEITAINQARGEPVEVSPLFAEALEAALRAAEITEGDVDPTCGQSLISLGYDRDFDDLSGDTSDLPGRPTPAAGWRCVGYDAGSRTVRLPDGVRLDFGATAKALAADRAAQAISERLGCGVLVNLGGDISVAGQAPDGGWRIGVDDGVNAAPGPDPTEQLSPASVTVRDGGVATSSPAARGWRRGGQAMHHIVVPSTGQPADVYWAAVSVAGATCVDANIASTAAIIRGRSAQQWLQDLGMPARLATPDGRVVTTAGWPA